METAHAVQTIGLGKRYGSVSALGAVDVSIENNEYFVLLGPSGGGKTTLLRLIGGFARATTGQVMLHGRNMTDVPPDQRPTSMVFQSYALFPHMNVAKNVGYGLRLQKLTRAEISQQVDRMLELVGLVGYGARMPHELSGGQQQRVQLARSLVLERDVLLLDEPLAALDAKLRKDMCFELKRIQEEVGITFVHVTHNQEEAMTVADRIALISGGELIEVGTPRDIYERPRRRFTAEFIGENNLFEGTIKTVGEQAVTLDLGHARADVLIDDTAARDTAAMEVGQQACLSIRSEKTILLTADDNPQFQSLPCTVVKDAYFGLTSAYLVRLASGEEAVARRLTSDASNEVSSGKALHLAWRTEDARLHID